MGALLDQFEASEKSGAEQAMAWVQAAADPAGTRERIGQLEAAAQRHDAALKAATEAEAAAKAATVEADKRLAECDRREAWCLAEQNRIKQSGQNIAEHHAALDKKRSDMAALADRLASSPAGSKRFHSKCSRISRKRGKGLRRRDGRGARGRAVA
jgi:uncharacterized coiled-coil protein SlyX